MVSGGDNFNPAVHTSYFANLERADVDSACHSCWAEPVGPDGESTPCNSLGGHNNHIWPGRGDNCGQWQTGNRNFTSNCPFACDLWVLFERLLVVSGQTLDGLVTCDGKDSPRGVWWAYKSYGSLQGTLLAVNASETGDAVAVAAADGRSVSLTVGRVQASPAGHCTGSAVANGIRVVIQNIPTSMVSTDGTVQVAQALIRNTGVLPLEAPSITTSRVRLSDDGAAAITINMNVSDAALVVLGPAASATVKAFAVPPPAAGQASLKLDDE